MLSKSASFRSSYPRALLLEVALGHSAPAPFLPAMPAVLFPAWPSDPRWPGTCHSIGTFPWPGVALLLQGICYYFSCGRPCLLCHLLDGPCLSPTAHSVGKSFCRDADLSRPSLGIGICRELCLHLSYLVVGDLDGIIGRRGLLELCGGLLDLAGPGLGRLCAGVCWCWPVAVTGFVGL